jgi:hypothetical protein
MVTHIERTPPADVDLARHAVLVTLKALSAAGVLDLMASTIVPAVSAATDDDPTDEAVPQ